MIQSVQRAAQILAVLGSGTPRLGVTEIADRTGLAKPTVHGLLRTLEAHDLVAQDPDTGKYSLGPGVLQLGNAYLDGPQLRARSLRWAESLAKRAGEAVGVATLSGSRVIVLHHVFRPDNTVQILEDGAAIPWHANEPSRASVALMREDQGTWGPAGAAWSSRPLPEGHWRVGITLSPWYPGSARPGRRPGGHRSARSTARPAARAPRRR